MAGSELLHEGFADFLLATRILDVEVMEAAAFGDCLAGKRQELLSVFV